MSEAEEEAEEENSEEVCEFHLENARVIVDNTQNFVVNTHVILLFMQNSNTTKNKWLFATIWKKLDSGSPLSSRFNCGDWPEQFTLLFRRHRKRAKRRMRKTRRRVERNRKQRKRGKRKKPKQNAKGPSQRKTTKRKRMTRKKTRRMTMTKGVGTKMKDLKTRVEGMSTFWSYILSRTTESRIWWGTRT